jgi:hypothetical protein
MTNIEFKKGEFWGCVVSCVSGCEGGLCGFFPTTHNPLPDPIPTTHSHNHNSGFWNLDFGINILAGAKKKCIKINA